MNDVFCSPDVSIFVCKMLGENLLLAKRKLSIWKSKKIHTPNMSLSCDIYRWQVYKKAITKFCYKDNFLCLSVFSNCAYFIAGCMRSLAFFSFPSSLLRKLLLIPLFQEIGKLCQLPIGSDLFENIQFDLWFSDYLKKIKSNIICSSFIPYLCFRPKESFKGSCPVLDFC